MFFIVHHVATIPSGSKYNDGLSNSVRDKMKPIFRIVSGSDRVDQLEEDSSVTHSTRLKEKVLRYFPQLDAYNEGRNVLFVAR